MSDAPRLGPLTQAGKDLLGVDWTTVEHHAEQIVRIETEARQQGVDAGRMTARAIALDDRTDISLVRQRHYVVLSPAKNEPVCPTCYSNLGKPRRWPCDVELMRRRLDEFVEAYREALERLSAPR